MEMMATTDAEKSAKTLTMVIYALYAASFLLVITAIVAIVINYVKKGDVAGTFLESHFRWQIRTFWFGLLWGVLGAIASLVVVGWFVLVASNRSPPYAAAGMAGSAGSGEALAGGGDDGAEIAPGDASRRRQVSMTLARSAKARDPSSERVPWLR
jgi:uncharacterized membrane protein